MITISIERTSWHGIGRAYIFLPNVAREVSGQVPRCKNCQSFSGGQLIIRCMSCRKDDDAKWEKWVRMIKRLRVEHRRGLHKTTPRAECPRCQTTKRKETR